jgi:tetratricopeptide (TPR) repeat protein
MVTQTRELVTTVARAVLVACLVLPGCSRKSSIERHTISGREHFEKRQYEGAIIEYTNVLKLDNLHAEAIRTVGLSYYALEDYRRALPFLAKIVELQPADTEPRIALGVVYLAGGRVEGARDQALACLSTDGANLEGFRLLVDASRGTNELAEAHRLATALATRLETNAAYHVTAGHLQLRRGDLDAAGEAFTKATQLNPQAPEGHLGLAETANIKGDKAAEAAACERALALSPKASPAAVAWAGIQAERGNSAAAKLVLEAAVAEEPEYVPAWHALARLALGDSDFDACREHALKVLTRQPGHVQAQLLLADAEMARGNTAQAISVYEKLVARFPAARDLRHALARALLWKRNPQRAITILSEALERDSDDTASSLLLAQAHLRVSNMTSAEKALEPLTQRDPPVATAFVLLARASLDADRPQEAVAILRRMAGRLPRLPQARYLLGSAHLAAGQTVEARAALGQALALDPTHIPALAKLTTMDLEAEQSEQALARVRKHIAGHAEIAGLHYVLGRVLLYCNELQAAEAPLLKATELAPALPGPYVLLTQVYQGQNKQEAALAKLEEALKHRPDDISVRMLAASLHAQTGDDARAAELYEQLLKQRPGFAPAANELACLYASRDRVDDAARLARRAREAMPNDPFIADTLGWILCRKGDYPWALTLLKESAAQSARQPEILYHLGVTQSRLGDETAARQTLEEALSTGRAFEGAKHAGLLLSVLKIDIRAIGAGGEAGRQILAALAQAAEAIPSEPAVLVRTAIAREHAEKWEEAATLYEELLDASPTHRGAVRRLAALYADRLGNPERAMALAKQARDQAPGDPRAAAELAWMAYRRGDAKWALSLFQESAAKLADDFGIQYRYGLVLFANGRMDAARQTVARALAAGQAFSDARQAERFLQLVDIIRKGDTSKGAATTVQAALRDSPDNAAALMADATIRSGTGKRSEAIAVFRRILQRHVAFTPALTSLAALLSEEKAGLAEAETLARKARAALPSDPEVAGILGTVLHKRGKHEWAASLLRERTTAGNASADTFYRLGSCERELGDKDAARRHLEQALKLDPAFAGAEDAKRLLSKLR